MLRSYIEKHWFIVAIRVHLEQSGGQLRRGVAPTRSSKSSGIWDVSKALHSDRRVIAALIKLLDYEYPTPREEAQAALVKITGQRLQGIQQWSEWWAKNKASFTTEDS